MTRSTISFPVREDLTSESSGIAILAFLTITHPEIAEPLRFVSDGGDYVRDGVTWTGIPFEFALLTDTDRPPETKIKIQNVDRVIGESIMAMGTEPARVKIELLSSLDFDETVEPRAEIGTAHVEYSASGLMLINISMNALEVSGSLKSWDYTQEIWPMTAATKDRLPALFR